MARRNACILCQRPRNVSERLAISAVAAHDRRSVSGLPFGSTRNGADHGYSVLLSGGWLAPAHTHSLWSSNAGIADDIRRCDPIIRSERPAEAGAFPEGLAPFGFTNYQRKKPCLNVCC